MRFTGNREAHALSFSLPLILSFLSPHNTHTRDAVVILTCAFDCFFDSKSKTMATAAGRLAADTVRYCLYPLIRKPDSSSPAQSSSSSSEQLSMYVIESLAKLNPLLSGYIWQNEPFSLHIQDQHPDAGAFLSLSFLFVVGCMQTM